MAEMRTEDLIQSLRDMGEPYNSDIDFEAAVAAADALQRMLDWADQLETEGGVGRFLATEVRARLADSSRVEPKRVDERTNKPRTDYQCTSCRGVFARPTRHFADAPLGVKCPNEAWREVPVFDPYDGVGGRL